MIRINKFQRLRREHITEICKELSLSDDIRKKSLAFLEKVEKVIDFGGFPPRGISASIVYMICQEHECGEKSKYIFAKKIGIASGTIEKHVNKIKEKLMGIE